MSAPPPSAGPSPLVHRAWVREAQRALRLAVTGAKAARTSYVDTAARGHAALSELCNLLLRATHLPTLPLGVLTQMPGVVIAAAAKLARLQQQQLSVLRSCCHELQAQAQEAVALAADLQALQAEPWQAGDTSTLSPGLGLCRAAEMLVEAVAPLALDVADKVAVLTAVEAQVQRQAQIPTTTSGLDPPIKPLLADALQGRCMVWLSVWLLEPHVLADRSEELLAVLSEALATC